MKRMIVFMLVGAMVATNASAQCGKREDGGMHDRFPGMEYTADFTKAELEAIKAETGDRPIGQLTLNEIAPFELRLREAAAKDRFVAEATAASAMMPGMGQFIAGNGGAGAGFMTAHLGIAAGTAVGAYFLLPANLRFDSLDYFNTSFTEIEARWNGHSFMDYLPAMGICLGGAVLDAVVRAWSADDAKRAATQAVKAGTVKVEADVFPGHLGMRFRY